MGWLPGAGRWLEARLDEERGRWFLWLPVLYGAGIAVYLGAPREPPFLLCVALLIVAATLRQCLRLTALRLILSTTLLMVASGFLTGKIRALIVDAPVLTRTIGAATLTARIEAVERYQKAFRVTLRIEAIEGDHKGAMPQRARLRYHGKAALPPIGNRIKLRASLKPPPEPAMPGGFDFARNYWFEGLGATGFVLGKVEALAAEPPPWDLWFTSAVGNLRQAIAARIAAVLSGEKGGLAQALIMGERASFSDETRLALTKSGLFHVVSISGFHMALTAGSAFWLIRALLAAFPALALSFPVKIWAAVAALVVATAYILISGCAVAAVRSYIMIAIMFGAIALNRPALSLRNLAISAFVILAIMPESLVDPGFQMSFAATAALIAVYEVGPHRLGAPSSWPWLLAFLANALIGDVITSLAASLSVDPIAAYHFHRIAIYGVLGNMLAMPAISLVVMPMALVALIAMPFGLETGPLLAMGAGLDMMMAIATWVAALPGAVIQVPAFGLASLVLMAVGGLWFLLWRGAWRLAGLVPIAVGLASAPFTGRPDIWIDREGQVIAVRLKDGTMSAPKTRKSEFSLKAWLEADGDGRVPRDAAKGTGFQCDEQSCLALVRGRIVAQVFHPGALADDCRRAAILISSLPVTEPCVGPEVIIDARDLWEKGAHTIAIGPGARSAFGSSRNSGSSSDASQGEDRIRVETGADDRGVRPWVISRHRRELIGAAPAEPRNMQKSGTETEDLSGLDGLGGVSQ